MSINRKLTIGIVAILTIVLLSILGAVLFLRGGNTGLSEKSDPKSLSVDKIGKNTLNSSKRNKSTHNEEEQSGSALNEESHSGSTYYEEEKESTSTHNEEEEKESGSALNEEKESGSALNEEKESGSALNDEEEESTSAYHDAKENISEQNQYTKNVVENGDKLNNEEQGKNDLNGGNQEKNFIFNIINNTMSYVSEYINRVFNRGVVNKLVSSEDQEKDLVLNNDHKSSSNKTLEEEISEISADNVVIPDENLKFENPIFNKQDNKKYFIEMNREITESDANNDLIVYKKLARFSSYFVRGLTFLPLWGRFFLLNFSLFQFFIFFW